MSPFLFPLARSAKLKIIFIGFFLIFMIGILFGFGKSNFQNIIYQYFQAALIERLKPGPEKEIEFKEEILPPAEEKIEIEEESLETPPEEETPSQAEVNLVEIQESLDEIEERIEFLNQEMTDLIEETHPIAEEAQEKEEIAKLEEEEVDEIDKEEIEEESDVGQEVGQGFCQKRPEDVPSRNRVIINEVAWMGGISSANDEWVVPQKHIYHSYLG